MKKLKNGKVLKEKMNINLLGNKEIYAITILEINNNNVLTKVQYNDGMVLTAAYSIDELNELI